MQKRGQVTLFIILGIIIATVIVLAVLYNQQLIFSGFQEQREDVAAGLPLQDEILEHLKNCIDEKTEEAVTRAGLQGGYITVPQDNIPEGLNNKFSNALLVAGSMKVPYWFYETSNGLQKQQAPSITTVQQQLEEYVRKSIADCSPEVAYLYAVETSEQEVTVEVVLSDEKVTFLIDYPVTISSKDLTFKTREMISTVNVPFGRFMGYANTLLKDDEMFLEERTIDMLVLYDELPYSGTEFTCSSKLWTKPKVRTDFKKIAAENIANIRLEDSENEAKGDYFNWDVLSSKNTKVNFFYSEQWPIELDIFPSEGELLKGDELNQQVGNQAAALMSSLFCLTNYHFIYNLKYPVLVTLYDTKTGFTLQYATMVIIDKNQPRENKYELEDYSLQNEICGSKTTQATVNTYEVLPGNDLVPLEDVNINYKCVNAICEIGMTDAQGRLTARFPECYNGFVVASKNDILTEKELFSTTTGGEISLLMDQLYIKDFEIKVMDNGQERNLRADEQAVIQLTEKDSGYITSVSTDQKVIKLPPGEYTLKSTIMQTASDFKITIKSETLEHCRETPKGILGVLGFSKTLCTETEIPETVLDQVIKGGATTPWTVTRNELGPANKITFYVPTNKLPTSYEDLTDIFNSIESEKGKVPFIL